MIGTAWLKPSVNLSFEREPVSRFGSTTLIEG
jgi:hypothetical protein